MLTLLKPWSCTPTWRQVRRHPLERARRGRARGTSASPVASNCSMRRAELEALRPLGPAAARVPPVDGEDRRAVLGPPGRVRSSGSCRRTARTAGRSCGSRSRGWGEAIGSLWAERPCAPKAHIIYDRLTRASPAVACASVIRSRPIPRATRRARPRSRAAALCSTRLFDKPSRAAAAAWIRVLAGRHGLPVRGHAARTRRGARCRPREALDRGRDRSALDRLPRDERARPTSTARRSGPPGRVRCRAARAAARCCQRPAATPSGAFDITSHAAQPLLGFPAAARAALPAARRDRAGARLGSACSTSARSRRGDGALPPRRRRAEPREHRQGLRARPVARALRDARRRGTRCCRPGAAASAPSAARRGWPIDVRSPRSPTAARARCACATARWAPAAPASSSSRSRAGATAT